MDREVHTGSNRSKGRLLVLSRVRVTPVRGTARQLPSDTQWECKGERPAAWAACLMAHRWDPTGSRDQADTALRARGHITVSQARAPIRVSSNPTRSLHKDKREDKLHIPGNLIPLRRLPHMVRAGPLISNHTCPRSHKGHCQDPPKDPLSLSPRTPSPPPSNPASLPTANSRARPVRLHSSPLLRLRQDPRANPATQDPHRDPRSSRHRSSNRRSLSLLSTRRGRLPGTRRTPSNSKHNRHLISGFLLHNSRRCRRTLFSPTLRHPPSRKVAPKTAKAAPPAFRTCQGLLTTSLQVQRGL